MESPALQALTLSLEPEAPKLKSDPKAELGVDADQKGRCGTKAP